MPHTRCNEQKSSYVDGLPLKCPWDELLYVFGTGVCHNTILTNHRIFTQRTTKEKVCTSSTPSTVLWNFTNERHRLDVGPTVLKTLRSIEKKKVRKKVQLNTRVLPERLSVTEIDYVKREEILYWHFQTFPPYPPSVESTPVCPPRSAPQKVRWKRLESVSVFWEGVKWKL